MKITKWDQSLVREMVRYSNGWDYNKGIEVTAVGKGMFLAIDQNGYEGRFLINDYWEIVKTKK